MKPLLVNTYDKGGAAKACIRLHNGLLSEGVESKLLLKNKNNYSIDDSYQISITTKKSNLQSIIIDKTSRIFEEFKIHFPKESKSKQFIDSRKRGLEGFSFPFSNYDLTKSDHFKQADVINLHWVANFLDYTSFFKNADKPIIWTLHDMNPFSGGEHFEEMYFGIDKNGNPIQRVYTNDEKRQFEKNISLKEKALTDVKNLHIVSPSKWHGKLASDSKLFNRFEVSVIPNGIDKEVFCPRDKSFSKELLNIEEDKKVLLFVNSPGTSKRKGAEYLREAVKEFSSDEFILLSVGGKSKTKAEHKFRELGVIVDELLMSIIYSAADVFIIPSLMDNLPNTALESLMCGTPVIGFPTGGIPEIIQDGINGFVTDEISVNALSGKIDKFLKNSNMFTRKEICKNAIIKYDISVQVNAYKELFNSLI